MQEMFDQSDDQRAILETKIRFVEEEIKPRSVLFDAETDPEATYSEELIAAADAVGLQTMALSEKYSGLGTGSVTNAMVIEELARGDVGASVSIGQTMKIAAVMERAPNEEQKARILLPFIADPQAMLNIGITEPENGSNYFLPHPVPFRTTGERAQGAPSAMCGQRKATRRSGIQISIRFLKKRTPGCAGPGQRKVTCPMDVTQWY